MNGLYSFVLVFVFTSDADAKMYKYKDENGKLHFTNDLMKVPEKYRDKKSAPKKKTPGKISKNKGKLYENTCQPSNLKHTLLHKAARNNDVTEAKRLISGGAHLDVQDQTCLTPLHIAASENKREMVQLLLSKGANPNVTGSGGWAMPLTSAITINKIEIVRLLIENGADVNATTVNNNGTPLMHAVNFGRIPILKLLIANGADIKFKNSDGLTALGVALEKGNKKIVNILKQNGAK